MLEGAILCSLHLVRLTEGPHCGASAYKGRGCDMGYTQHATRPLLCHVRHAAGVRRGRRAARGRVEVFKRMRTSLGEGPRVGAGCNKNNVRSSLVTNNDPGSICWKGKERMSLEKDVQEPGPDERCPQKKVATQRRVSFRPGDPIELPQVPSLPYLDQTPTDDGSDDETTDGPDKYRGRSRSEVAPTVIERFLVTRERKWSVTLASLVAAIPAFVLGLTLGYPSNALLDLTGDATELPPEFFFSTSSLSLFTVSLPSRRWG